MDSSSSRRKLKDKNVEPEDLERGVKEVKNLFRSSFVMNCHLDNASVTSEELKSIKLLSFDEVIDNLRDLVDSLLNFKRNAKDDKSGELALRCEQLEKLLQKQENEVRARIRNENQLKLQIDILQQNLSLVETNCKEYKAKIKEMEEKGSESFYYKVKNVEKKFREEIKRFSQDYKVCRSDSFNLRDLGKIKENYDKKSSSNNKFNQNHVEPEKLLENSKVYGSSSKIMDKSGLRYRSVSRSRERNGKSIIKIYYANKTDTEKKLR